MKAVETFYDYFDTDCCLCCRRGFPRREVPRRPDRQFQLLSGFELESAVVIGDHSPPGSSRCWDYLFGLAVNGGAAKSGPGATRQGIDPKTPNLNLDQRVRASSLWMSKLFWLAELTGLISALLLGAVFR